MALTFRGFTGGPLADIDFGVGIAGGAWAEGIAALAVTQPNTGTRTISIAAGNGAAFGVRVFNDAAITQALSAPTSGGAWYLIALRFVWSTKTVALQVLSGTTTGGTTVPTIAPTALPATETHVPGTSFDMPLAWVFVSSANTTATIFDVRMVRTGALLPAAVTLMALYMAMTSQAWLLEGSVVGVLRHRTANGGLHIRSTWQKDVGGALLPIGVIETDNTGAVGRGTLDDITDIVGAPPIGTLGTDRSFPLTRRWGPPSAGGTNFWRAWDSDWFGCSIGVQGLNGAYGASNGFVSDGAEYRYRGGKVRYRGDIFMNSGGSVAGQISISLPIAAYVKFNASLVQAGINAHKNSGGDFPLNGFVSGSYVYTGTNEKQVAATSPTAPFTWAQSDAIYWDFEYEPAAT